MKYRRTGHIILARLEVGEEILESLRRLGRAEMLPWASFTGLGAVNRLTLALYDPAQRRYLESSFEEDLEVATMTGNFTWLGEEAVVHAHGVFSRADCSTLGGHIVRGVVSLTLEVSITAGPVAVERAPDEALGLNLLALDQPPS